MFKSQEKLIAEIHNEFDTAQERLFNEANELLKSIDIPSITKVEKIADRLLKAGFVSTPTVKLASRLTKRRKESEKLAVTTKEQAELIQYYKFNYPFLKFLTEGELNRICEKYNLIHAPVVNYIKEVPEKNLTDIENAQQLKAGDIQPTLHKVEVHGYWPGVPLEIRDIFKKGVYVSGKREVEEASLSNLIRNTYGYSGDYNGYIFQDATVVTINKSGLFIAAPKGHFNLTGLEKKSRYGFFQVFKTEVKDPIVFRYVVGGIQVLTKWGLEAEDPALVNEKFN